MFPSRFRPKSSSSSAQALCSRFNPCRAGVLPPLLADDETHPAGAGSVACGLSSGRVTVEAQGRLSSLVEEGKASGGKLLASSLGSI